MQLLLPRLSSEKGLCYQPPLKEYWLHGWKTQIHTVVQFELAFLAQLLGATFILPGEVCPQRYSQLHTSPPALNFSHSVIFRHCSTSPTAHRQEWPMATPPEISHCYIAPWLFFLRSLTNSPSPLLLSVCLPVGTRKYRLFFPPSNWPMAFLLIDQEPIGEQDISISPFLHLDPYFTSSVAITCQSGPHSSGVIAGWKD